MRRVMDWCKRCGNVESSSDPFSRIAGGRGWCLSCEDQDEARQRAEERERRRAREAFLALPDGLKWEMVYETLFERRA